jgi:glycosyltransferase involved in cell wall biosynthesis
VVLTVWDPARCFSLLQQARHLLPQGTQWWGYFPVDGWTRNGSFGGPAAAAVQQYDRVLGYGRWGGTVLSRVVGRQVPYLPHGIHLETFQANPSGEEYQQARATLGKRVTDQTLVIGCVAANQPRKDLGVYCETLAELARRGLPIHGWLHTDFPIGTRESQWVVPQLMEEYGLQRRLTVTTTLDDRQLAALYSLCAATIAPGLGEGFGYPIVESLACGVPAIHSTYAGGAELVPRSEWRVPVRAERVEGPYALVRPVYTAEDFANAVERAISWRRSQGVVGGPYCRGAVQHLDWAGLWLRWASWVREGVRAF